jgi:hypothetical protein
MPLGSIMGFGTTIGGTGSKPRLKVTSWPVVVPPDTLRLIAAGQGL